MKSYQQFFAEMKRRRVFRVMAVYGATAGDGKRPAAVCHTHRLVVHVYK